MTATAAWSDEPVETMTTLHHLQPRCLWRPHHCPRRGPLLPQAQYVSAV